jgi:hypothetical protein
MGAPMTKLWEKQEWESPLSYRHFQKYFLLQVFPRTLGAAYRRFQMEKKGKTAAQVKKIAPSQSWYNWSRAVDKNGVKVHPNAATWEERANAYDDMVIEEDQDAFKESRTNLLTKEQEDAANQLEFWTKLFDDHRKFVGELKEKSKTDDEVVYNPTRLITKSKELWKWREDIAVFARRAVGMPAIIKEAPKSKDDDEGLEIEWSEPFEKGDIGVSDRSDGIDGDK